VGVLSISSRWARTSLPLPAKVDRADLAFAGRALAELIAPGTVRRLVADLRRLRRLRPARIGAAIERLGSLLD
jgi:hypothetical protein